MPRPVRRPPARPAAPLAPQLAPYLLALGAVVAVTGLAGCGPSRAEAAPEAAAAIPVRVAVVTNGEVADTITATGTTAGREEVPLAFKIGGVVEHVAPRAGDAVRAGAVLARLRPTEVAAQVTAAAEGEAKAARDLARAERLWRDSVVTLAQLEDARTALAVARAQGRVARFNADFATVRAPGDGIVLRRAAEPGELVEAGRPVLVVRRGGSGLVVRAALVDRDALRVRPGDTAIVTLDALPDRRFAGRVARRGAAADAGSGSYEVEVALGPDADALPSGLVAQVRLVPHRGGDVDAAARPRVPIEALVDADGDSAAVFVLAADGRTVERRRVTLVDVAEALGGAALPVARGVRAGERVVTGNAHRLVAGARVAVEGASAAHGADAPAWRSVR